ncbi:MAG: RNA polymerase subunit sigma-70 [Flavobacteriaceae bacterium]|nr:RNA polymerase subunit sigma-70 [Flavobacteriaceae bacterium]
MKIISLHKSQQSIIQKAIRKDRQAQKRIFDQHAPKMKGVCRQYVKDNHHAEELMMSGFLKVFGNLEKFKGEGSFEGWIRKIMVNTCLNYLKKKNPEFATDEDFYFEDQSIANLEQTSVEDIQKLIDRLPDGYKMVFNLYAIEGYKHHEISKKLGISENTSKSQLFKARKFLQEAYINEHKLESHGRI